MEELRQERIKKFREERIARENARLNKLKQLNISKYNSTKDSQNLKSVSNTSIINKSSFKIPAHTQRSNGNVKNLSRPSTVGVTQNNGGDNKKCETKIPKIIPINNKNVQSKYIVARHEDVVKKEHVARKEDVTKKEHVSRKEDVMKKEHVARKEDTTKRVIEKKPNSGKDSLNSNAKFEQRIEQRNHVQQPVKPKFQLVTSKSHSFLQSDVKQSLTRKSIAPSLLRCPKNTTVIDNKRESVFERLYKPKAAPKVCITLHQDTQTKKSTKEPVPVVRKRQTMFEPKKLSVPNVRRSISAIHLKRVSKSELSKCFHKWSSIGERLNKAHLTEVNEDENVQKVNVSAVKSDRKKSLKFPNGVSYNLNAPTGDELQSRLKNWLQKRGKSMDSYHHLQCFGLHHIAQNAREALNFKPYEEEDKENFQTPDGDDNSYTDNLSDRKNDFDNMKWRRASYVSDSIDMNISKDTSILSSDAVVGHSANELLLGALNDLCQLLNEGFDWEQCARWLRALRERFPLAPETAPYWECRAALEQCQGNFPASVQCWEEAIAKGTEKSVVEASLDQLLDKFMQLKISPSAGKRNEVAEKFIDVKNVFKSTVIKFAVQQAKLKQSDAKYTATPVRRSSRLSTVPHATPLSGKKRTPLVQLCSTMRQIDEEVRSKLVFIPNKTLEFTP